MPPRLDEDNLSILDDDDDIIDDIDDIDDDHINSDDSESLDGSIINNKAPQSRHHPDSMPQMSRDELWSKLKDAERFGVSSTCDKTSNIQELRYEYERVQKHIQTERQVKFARRMLMMCVSGLEFMNTTYNPAGLHLDGWSDQVMSSVDDYDGILERLAEKWQSRVDIAPEIELILTLGGSAFMFHLTSSMFKSAPSIGDVAKDNPDLMKEIAKAMAKNISGGGMSRPAPVNPVDRMGRPDIIPNITPSSAEQSSSDFDNIDTIPLMARPSIDILSKIMPSASADAPIDTLFTQSLVNSFKPPEPTNTMMFDTDTKIVELPMNKTKATKQQPTSVIKDDDGKDTVQKNALSLD